MKRLVAWTMVPLMIFLTAGLVFASVDGSKIFNNGLKTSGVQIKVMQMHETPEGIEEIGDGVVFDAGHENSYIPRVKVVGSDSYVRLRLQVDMNEGCTAEVSEDDIYGLNEDWVKKGDWFYCRSIVKKNEFSDVFAGIRTPDVSGRECSGFRTHITADAIQAYNFQPDFEQYEPWGDVKIQTSDITADTVLRTASVSEKDELVIENDGRISCGASDLFSSFEDLLPGDTRESDLIIRNMSGEKKAVYFRTRNDDSELLGEAGLTIWCNERPIYEGKLASKELQRSVKLARIENGGKAVFKFRIQLPESADNAFQKTSDKVVWIFETHEKNGKIQSHIVKTGDRFGTGLLIAIALCTMAAAVLLIMAIKRIRDEKNS